MSRRGVGFLLVLTATIALGALVQEYRFNSLISVEHATARAFDGQVRDLDQTVYALQGALQASVATGQTPGDWLDRAARLTTEVESAVARQRDAAQDAQTIAALDAAAGEFATFRKIDGQIRSSLEQGDRLHASDVIFLDAAGAIQKIHDSFAAARARNRELVEGNVRQLARLQMGMTGVAVLFVLAVAIYFGRAVTILGRKAEPSMTQMLRDLPPPVKPGSSPATAASAAPPAQGPAAPAPAAAPAATQPAAAQPAAAQPAAAQRPTHLAAAAELCVDLAKVLDAQDVPVLLARTATVLDARGIVLWAVDSDGARLRPSLSHGYSDRVLAKLRPLQIDGDNVTSLAYRSLQPQTMNGATAADPAAVAIPLLTGTGCVGVMAVELRHNRPHADLLPIARIVGAQLSTLIAPPDEAGARTANASS
jgi:hypothetical protein